MGAATTEPYVHGRNGHAATFERGRQNHTTRNTMAQHDDFDAPEALLTPSEVAALFRVNPKTVTRWARSGKLTAIRTLGGHRRFKASEIRRCLEEMSHEPN
jgi:excisionase family DNA binding protein